MKPAPVTRSKGGWRRKPRRITPYTICTYWPGTQRVSTLRRTWPGYKPNWMIIDMVNRHPAPKPVNIWQVRMMASHLKLRRPHDIGKFTKACYALGPEVTAFRLRGKHGLDSCSSSPVHPESAMKLRKVGAPTIAKPKAPKRATPVTYSPGLTISSKKYVQVRTLDDRRGAARRARIRKLYKAGWTGPELATRFGVKRWAIYELCSGLKKYPERRAKKSRSFSLR